MADLAASIKARLLAGAQARGEEFERTLARFAAERLLYRLGRSGAGERCVLKGASLLAVWLADPHRATRDVDVLASGPSDDAAIRGLVREVCGAPCPEDALRFDLADLAVETIRAEEGYPGKRARFWALLGSARIRVQLDVGFGDAVAPAPRRVELPTLLPAMPAPRLLAYPPEASLAEKFEAMVKLDVRNSRMKDFHDVWSLSDAMAFEGPSLQRAITACFERRGTPWPAEAPRVLTPAFYRLPELDARWRSYRASGSLIVQPPAPFRAVGERIVEFLEPVRQSIVGGVPFLATWAPRGPWTSGPSGGGARPAARPDPAA